MFFCIFFSENHDFASRFILMIGQNFRQHHTVRMVLPQSVEKLTGAHTEGEIKVLVELFQKLAGS